MGQLLGDDNIIEGVLDGYKAELSKTQKTFTAEQRVSMRRAMGIVLRQVFAKINAVDTTMRIESLDRLSRIESLLETDMEAQRESMQAEVAKPQRLIEDDVLEPLIENLIRSVREMINAFGTPEDHEVAFEAAFALCIAIRNWKPLEMRPVNHEEEHDDGKPSEQPTSPGE